MYSSIVSDLWVLVLALVPEGKGSYLPKRSHIPGGKLRRSLSLKGMYMCVRPLEAGLGPLRKSQTPLLMVLSCVSLRRKERDYPIQCLSPLKGLQYLDDTQTSEVSTLLVSPGGEFSRLLSQRQKISSH